MKFDYIIGNPPYQEETGKIASSLNTQKPSKSVFQYFQDAISGLVKKDSVLIYPGGRWLHRFGKGMQDFGLRQINDPHLKKVIFYPNSRELFSGVDITDGISIVILDMRKTKPGFEYVYVKDGVETKCRVDNPGEKLIALNPADMPIAEKVDRLVAEKGLSWLHDRILSRSLFGIESTFIEENGDKAKPIEEVKDIDFSRQVKLLANDKAGSAGRTKWFVIDRDEIKSNIGLIGEWQVVATSANPGGQRRDNQLEIIDNHSAFGRSRVALGSFKTEDEAKNFFKYLQSRFARFMLLLTNEALTSVGKRVPDLGDYSSGNGTIDFAGDIDNQLKKLFNLTEEEFSHMRSTVDNLRD